MLRAAQLQRLGRYAGQRIHGPNSSYAAGTRERADIIRDNSRRDAPSVRSDRMSRSIETDGSPASIFAIRDWLDRSRLASSACVRFPRRRHSRSPIASCALSSTYAASSAVNRRNSWAVPTFQPFASRRRRFCSRTVVLLHSANARVDDRQGCCPGGLAEDRQNHDSIGIGPIHDPPVGFAIPHTQLVAACTHNGHRPRVRHGQCLPLLQQPKEIASFKPGRLRERWSLDLSVKPDERLVARAHGRDAMSDPTWRQVKPHNLAVERTRFARRSLRRSPHQGAISR
jgi:hypothetical protein